MTTIKVTPDQLLSVSKQFGAAQSQIAQMNHILKQQLFEIERQWSGSTKERFYADFVAAQRVMENFISLSLSIAKTLEGHAEKFRLADQQAVQTYDANCMPPPPNACQAPVTDTRNFFQKSADSLAELGTAFMQAADDRYPKRYDSVGGFLDYWTFGIPSGLVEGYMDRANKAFDSPNDTANWLTFGIHGTIREAIFPTNAWSSEHWANMMGMGGMMVGGGLTAKMIKPHNLLKSSGGGTKIGAFNRQPGTGPMTEASLGLYRRTANLGEFSHLEVPMQLREVKRLAEQAGIGLNGVKVKIIRDAEMIRLPHAGWANPNGKEIQLYPNAFINEEQLVKTLAHERTHLFQVKIYGEAKDITMLDKFEEGAYGIENVFWNYFNRRDK
ncbi:WXG100 family type VII secretion target [Paenibacillus silvae]|uniref:WXG100 family type VII secretion target n=1 Tax=Paenibacillus silvae TaxID=1325358 RepID=UPI003CF880B3